jgi:hypothetical protein
MFIIFGWSHTRLKEFGALIMRMCEHCHNEAAWHLVSRSVWFTLFFIPVFPYERDHFLICPVCRTGLQLTDEQFAGLKAMAEDGSKAPSGAYEGAPAGEPAAAPAMVSVEPDNGSPVVTR